MKSTENVKTDFKALREKAGLTLEALAGKIGYAIATVNGLENHGTGSKRLREVVLKTLAAAVAGEMGDAAAVETARRVEKTAAPVSAEERARAAEEKLARVYRLLAELTEVLRDGRRAGSEPPARLPGENVLGRTRKPVKFRRTRLRDIASVSLRVFGTIPAGWPQNLDDARGEARYERVARGRFPEGAFGLDVRGDSMNAAAPDAIRDGETVILLSPDLREPRHNDIVAALCDGQTTLKRLHCPPGEKCVLRAESSNPAVAREIVPAHELMIQGVMVGKL